MLTSLNHHLCLPPKQNLGGQKFQYVCEVETVVAHVIIQYIGLYQQVLAKLLYTMTCLDCVGDCGKVVA
jgi:hypothetical protein